MVSYIMKYYLYMKGNENEKIRYKRNELCRVLCAC